MIRRTTQLTVGIFASLVAALPARADLIKQQLPCAGTCVVLTSNAVATARTFTFNAPGRGRAIVSFQGTLVCANNNISGDAFLNIQSQIVENNAQPSGVGPSGLEYQKTLPSALSATQTDTFNLSSTRVFPVNGAGARTYQFRVAPGTLSGSVGCSVRAGAFRVHFVDRD
jgi:hypothetical protein